MWKNGQFYDTYEITLHPPSSPFLTNTIMFYEEGIRNGKEVEETYGLP
jgi:hypothetical protein